MRQVPGLRRILAGSLVCLLLLLQGCAHPPGDVRQRVDALLPADLILLGEQHDADAHQQLQRAVVQDLAGRGQLAALAIEMAEQVQGSTNPQVADMADAIISAQEAEITEMQVMLSGGSS